MVSPWVCTARPATWHAWCILAYSGCRPRKDQLGLDSSHLDCTSNLGCRARSKVWSMMVSSLRLRLELIGKLFLKGRCSDGRAQDWTCIWAACLDSPLWTPSSACRCLLPKVTTRGDCVINWVWIHLRLSCQEFCIPIWTDQESPHLSQSLASLWTRMDVPFSSSMRQESVMSQS